MIQNAKHLFSSDPITGRPKLSFVSVKESNDMIAEAVVNNLKNLCAVDSQSEESSPTIPSTEGQKVLAGYLHERFSKLGLISRFDRSMNLIVTIPASDTSVSSVAPVALMVHMDTSEGTVAAQDIFEIPHWDGSTIPFPANPELIVNKDVYPHISGLVGQSVIHGEGKAPYGLDNKNGAAQLVALAELLVSNPEVPHGAIHLCFRCDEEIARHAGVESLVDELLNLGVTYGWTVDGFVPFEVNVRNFNASKAQISFPTNLLPLNPVKFAEEISFEVTGVDAHGATAHEEGYLNCTVIFADIAKSLEGNTAITPVYFDRISGKETSGRLSFLITGQNEDEVRRSKEETIALVEKRVAPHRAGGAAYSVTRERTINNPGSEAFNDGAIQVARHLNQFLSDSIVTPLLSESSSGNEGYSNPHKVSYSDGKVTVEYRLRDFSKDYLKAREDDLKRICPSHNLGDAVITQQYEDMSHKLSGSPQLLQLAQAAFVPLAGQTKFSCEDLIVRGGTGVDAFSKKGISIANLGAGYFFLESAKELTSRELLTLHTLWLVNLVQAVALTSV